MVLIPNLTTTRGRGLQLFSTLFLGSAREARSEIDHTSERKKDRYKSVERNHNVTSRTAFGNGYVFVVINGFH